MRHLVKTFRQRRILFILFLGLIFFLFQNSSSSAKVVGGVDDIEAHGNICGWATDPTSPLSSATIYFYMNGPPATSAKGDLLTLADGINGSGLSLGSIQTNLLRSDVNANLKIEGNHGFCFSITKAMASLPIRTQSLIQSGRAQALYAYAYVGASKPTSISQLKLLAPSRRADRIFTFSDVNGVFSSRDDSVGAFNFQILIDLNQLRLSDFSGDVSKLAPLAADGVWAIPINSSIDMTTWASILKNLNGTRWTVSEDNPKSSYNYTFLKTALGRPVDGAFIYFEDKKGFYSTLTETAYYQTVDQSIFFPGNIPSAHQISDVINGNPDREGGHLWEAHEGAAGKVVVHTRSYGPNDPRRKLIDWALADPRVQGAAFEQNAYGPRGISAMQWWSQLGLADFVNANLNALVPGSHQLAHKKAYIILSGVQNYSGNFLHDVQQTIPYLTKNGLLNNPDVYIVLANYGRWDANGNSRFPHIGVLSGDAGTDPSNSLLAASQWLQKFRTMASAPPKTLGSIDGLVVRDGQNFVQGWACIEGSKESQPVQLFTGNAADKGGVFWQTVIANAVNEPAVSSKCRTTANTYRFFAPLSATDQSALSHKPIFGYVISPFGIGKTIMANSGLVSIP